jgi:hypothetical protein
MLVVSDPAPRLNDKLFTYNLCIINNCLSQNEKIYKLLLTIHIVIQIVYCFREDKKRKHDSTIYQR